MPYYIRIERLNGRTNFYEFVRRLEERGYGDNVEYSQGGQMDETGIHYVDPHLKFENIEDALAYSLTYGGKVRKEMPTYVIVGG